MNAPDRHQDELSSERAVNERYLKLAQEWHDHGQHVGGGAVAVPQNAKWVDKAPMMPVPGGPIAPLIGRVALSEPDQDLMADFYIGSCYTPLPEGATVVSWVAGAASLFFEGRAAAMHSPEGLQPHTVAARRSFMTADDRLEDFEDDIEPDAPSGGVFPSPPPPSIPKPPLKAGPAGDEPRPDGAGPPSIPKPPLKAGPAGDEPRPGTTRRSSSVPAVGPASTDSAESAVPPDARAPSAGDEQAHAVERPERAARLLGEALEAPKTGRLPSVLATLQPEQYRLVTWPLGRNLVVQGHPGTGKTIVAAHRAAYLVLPKDTEGERLDKVALVGPTDRWKRYIEPAVRRLVEEGVEVLSLESLVREWADLPSRDLHPVDERWFHSDWKIGRMVDLAARRLESRLRQPKRRGEKARMLVDELVRDTPMHRQVMSQVMSSEDDDLREWLLQAGGYSEVRKDRSFLLLLAAVGMKTGFIGQHSGYQHIVVDEVQDIRPVEWWMLTKLFRDEKPRWSLFGDMNQRRSDFTWESWELLTDRLELAAVGAEPEPPSVLGAGYRSTREILRYADALLPRAMRGHDALRRGPEPHVRPAGPTQVLEAAKQEADRLVIRHRGGSVAVIAWDQGSVQKVERLFLKDGWRLDTTEGRVLRRRLGSVRLTVGRPVEVRGLEFDAVVVVEPADFGGKLGHGELYTSLTRANKELAVVQSKAMPRELRGRGNRIK